MTPPFEVPDEVGHYWRASSIAYGTIAGPRTTIMPRGFAVFVWLLWTPERGRHLTIAQMRAARGVPLESELRVPLRTPAYYSPAAYLPQIAAALAARSLNVRPFYGFYVGRLATLIASLIVVLLACQLTPRFRDHFEAVTLLPMSLSLFGSWSADAMTIASAFLATALLLRAILADVPLEWREMIALSVSLAWLSLCKPSYALIAVLAFCIPAQRFGSVARLAFFSVLSLVVLAGVVVSASLTYATAVAFHRPDLPVDAHAQLHFIAGHPMQFVSIIIGDLRASVSGYLESMTGRIGLYELKLPLGITLLLLATLAAIGLTNGPALPLSVRLLALLAATAILLGILTYLYVTASIAGGSTIEGTQGRYVLPLLPLLLATMRIRRIRRLVPPVAIVVVAVVANAVAIAVLVHRYW
jgi:uncharacterized membrane protein